VRQIVDRKKSFLNSTEREDKNTTCQKQLPIIACFIFIYHNLRQ